MASAEVRSEGGPCKERRQHERLRGAQFKRLDAARCRTVQGHATLGQTASRVLGAHVRAASAAPRRRIGKRARCSRRLPRAVAPPPSRLAVGIPGVGRRASGSLLHHVLSHEQLLPRRLPGVARHLLGAPERARQRQAVDVVSPVGQEKQLSPSCGVDGA